MSAVVLTVGYQFSLWLRLCGLFSINANVIESGCCEGIIPNAIMLSLLAIASPKRIREISDRPNWKITVKGVGGRRFIQAGIFHVFLQWHWFDLVVAAVTCAEVGLYNLSEITLLLKFRVIGHQILRRHISRCFDFYRQWCPIVPGLALAVTFSAAVEANSFS